MTYNNALEFRGFSETESDALNEEFDDLLGGRGIKFGTIDYWRAVENFMEEVANRDYEET